jgi:hypothetical protein
MTFEDEDLVRSELDGALRHVDQAIRHVADRDREARQAEFGLRAGAGARARASGGGHGR